MNGIANTCYAIDSSKAYFGAIKTQMSEDILDAHSGTETFTREIEIGLDPKFMGNEERAINRILNLMKYKYNYE